MTIQRKKMRTWTIQIAENEYWIYKSNYLENSSEIQYQIFVNKGKYGYEVHGDYNNVYQGIIFTPNWRDIELNDIIEAFAGHIKSLTDLSIKNAKEE